MSKASSNTSVTGRDGFIMAKALYWALKFSQRQPESIREFSDESDMKAILNKRFALFAAGLKMTDQNLLALLEHDAASGISENDRGILVAYATPPDLSDDPDFLEDGDAPTLPPAFVDEDDK